MVRKKMIIIDQINFNNIDATDGDGFNFIPLDVDVSCRMINAETIIPAKIKIEFEDYSTLNFDQLTEHCEQRIISTLKS